MPETWSSPTPQRPDLDLQIKTCEHQMQIHLILVPHSISFHTLIKKKYFKCSISCYYITGQRFHHKPSTKVPYRRNVFSQQDTKSLSCLRTVRRWQSGRKWFREEPLTQFTVWCLSFRKKWKTKDRSFSLTSFGCVETVHRRQHKTAHPF